MHVSYLSNWPKPQTVKIKKETSKRSVFSPSIIINRTIFGKRWEGRAKQTKLPHRFSEFPHHPIISASNFPVIVHNIFRPITKEKLFPSPLFEQRQRKIDASTDLARAPRKCESILSPSHRRREEMTLPHFRVDWTVKHDPTLHNFTRNRITCNYRAREGGRRIAFGSLAFSVGKLRIFVRGYGHFARASNAGGVRNDLNLNSLTWWVSRGSSCQAGKLRYIAKNFLLDDVVDW